MSLVVSLCSTCLSDAWDGHALSEQSLWEINFPYVEGGLLGKRDHKPEMDKSFRREKEGWVCWRLQEFSVGRFFSAAPSPPGKFVRLVLVFSSLQITAHGGVIALADQSQVTFLWGGWKEQRILKNYQLAFLGPFCKPETGEPKPLLRH